MKGLTAIILKDTPGEKELPQMERREGKDWIGLRIRNKGKVTDLYINQLADGRLCIVTLGLKLTVGLRMLICLPLLMKKMLTLPIQRSLCLLW